MRRDEVENIVDEQQHILAFLVPEIPRYGKTRQGHPHTGAGKFIHLSENQSDLVGHTIALHLVPEVGALPAAIAHTGEDGVAVVLHGHIVNQFLGRHSLTPAPR